MEIIINEPCTFGKWQGKPLLWQPISNKDGCTLLVTMEALEARMAHNENGNTSWEHCSLRSELNGAYFYKNNDVFTEEERKHIILATNKNDGTYFQNQKTFESIRTKDWADTQDYVFLLSVH